jgi:cell division initiation protein
MDGPVHDFPYYRSPDSIRSEVFSHRMRGVDEAEVREYLDLLAEQVHAADQDRAATRAENEQLRNEIERLQVVKAQGARPRVNEDSIALFSRAQQVADQLVEEAVVHARDLMASARNQQREILQQAHDAATAARGSGASPATAEYAPPVGEFAQPLAQVVQIQLRSVLEALGEQIDKLGQVTSFGSGDRPGTHPRPPDTTDSTSRDPRGIVRDARP